MIALVFGISACQTGFVPISQRDYLHEKEGKSPNLGHRRPVEERSESAAEIFVKRESIAIVPQETKNFTGSLFSLKRPENSLFMELARGRVGEILDVVVKVNRAEVAPVEAKDNANATATSGASAASEVKGKELQDELILALPKLEPGNSSPKVPNTIKMRVIRAYENGDVMVEAARASKNDWDANSIRVVCRIPRIKLQGNLPINTFDLADVHWYELQGPQIIQRESFDWQDEYTLRWAGFEEARSKAALDLEAKRLDMQKVKDRLQDRIVNLSKERGQIAVERERVRKLREEAEVKLNELNRKMEDQSTLIDQQKEIIKKQEILLDTPQGSIQDGNQSQSPSLRKDLNKNSGGSDQVGGKK